MPKTALSLSSDPVLAFQSSMADAGVLCPELLVADGILHRFKDGEDKNRSRNGWYVLYLDGIPAGAFGSWKTGLSETWSMKSRDAMTQAERQAWQKQMKEAKAKREAEQEKIHAEARKKAKGVWQVANTDPTHHPYIKSKQITPYGIKQRGTTLIIPLRDSENVLRSLQFINNDGSKRFLTGGKISGCYCAIGSIKDKLFVCEGYATGATLHETTGEAVAIAFDCGNLLPVSKALREKYPDTEIVICADNDAWTDGNPGVTKAKEAAKSVDGKLAIPQFKETTSGPTDFNDLRQLEEIDAVKEQILRAKPLTSIRSDGSSEVSKDKGTDLTNPDSIHKPVAVIDNVAAPSIPFIQNKIKLLANLSSIEYDQVRRNEAKQLGIRVSTLDAKVQTERLQYFQNDTKQGNVFLNDPEPYPESVNINDVLDEISQLFTKYLVLPEGAAEILTLWAAHTHVFDAFQHTPRLNITSPESECGKTLLLDVLETVTPKSLRTENVTTAVLFRIIDKESPTLLIDEYDTFLKGNNELRGGLNAGHKRGGQHLRCDGDSNEVKAFKTFAPVALAGIRALTGTLSSRSIVIQLKRAKKSEIKQHFDSRHIEHEQKLIRKLARWAKDNAEQLKAIEPELPPDLYNRPADNWRPLFAIAENVGEGWPERLKNAYVLLTNNEDVEDTASVMLLEDINGIFETKYTDKITSSEIVDELANMEERPWPEWGKAGKPITTRQIARLLKPFGIKPKTLRFETSTKKGYIIDNFKDTFERYLDNGSVTSSQSNENKDLDDNLSVTELDNVTDQKSPKPALNKDCYVVTDHNTNVEEREEYTSSDRTEVEL